MSITRTAWTDDDGTGSTGTIINNAEKTTLYDQIDAIFTTAPLDISGAAAGQIKFPAAQNPSANVNTLDDYEEGTFTPSLGGSTTYTTQVGTYTKIGRAVHIQVHLLINAIGTGSTSLISGLPFTPAAQNAGAVGFVGTSVSNVVSIVCLFNTSAQIQLYSLLAAGATYGVNAIFQSGTDLYLSGTYFV